MNDAVKKRTVHFLITRLCLIAAIILVILGAFFSSMKTSNVYFLLQDAMKRRLDVILLGADIDESNFFYSYNYLQGIDEDEAYQELVQKYSFYDITNYGYKFSYSHLFVWPWQKTKTVTVKEAVFSINGMFATSDMTKAEAMAYDLYNVPQWDNSVYKVKLVLEDGVWKVDSVTRKGTYKFKPVETPALSKEEIEAMYTPTPAPTEPGQQGQDKNHATISTALRGETVNLREGPATQYEVIGKLQAGDRLTVLEESDGWYKVVTESGLEGYVSGYYLNFE